tara:strand:+ start:17084 stop:17209 length:126 start_codon:yes stop_codon:yes gene_type:complete
MTHKSIYVFKQGIYETEDVEMTVDGFEDYYTSEDGDIVLFI